MTTNVTFTVTTDLLDYAPGSTALITAEGVEEGVPHRRRAHATVVARGRYAGGSPLWRREALRGGCRSPGRRLTRLTVGKSPQAPQPSRGRADNAP